MKHNCICPNRTAWREERAARLPAGLQVAQQARWVSWLLVAATRHWSQRVTKSGPTGQLSEGPGDPALARRSPGLGPRTPAQVTTGLHFLDASRGETGHGGDEPAARENAGVSTSLEERSWRACSPAPDGPGRMGTHQMWMHGTQPGGGGAGKSSGWGNGALAPGAPRAHTRPCVPPRVCTPSSRAAGRTPHHCSGCSQGY